MIQQPFARRQTSGRDKFQNYALTPQNYIYKIISKSCNMALKPEIRQKQVPEDEIKIIGGIEDDKSIKQLWLLKTIKDWKVEIVNFATDLVIQSEEGDAKLQKGKQKNSQKFQFQPWNIRLNLNETTQIRIKDSSGLYLTLDGTLDATKFNDTDQNQQFYLKRVDIFNYREFQQTFVITNPETKKCLDVTGGSEQVGAAICLYHLNMRANQRWTFDPPLKSDSIQQIKYSIINMNSGLRLWVDKHGNLVQTDDIQRNWQLKKKHDLSGELYFINEKKYLNKNQQDKLVLKGSSNGTKWEIY